MFKRRALFCDPVSSPTKEKETSLTSVITTCAGDVLESCTQRIKKSEFVRLLNMKLLTLKVLSQAEGRELLLPTTLIHLVWFGCAESGFRWDGC